MSKKSKKSSEEDYDNSNTGALFKNEDKEKPTHPDYRGKFTDENGKEFWLAGWIKTAKKTKQKYISLSATAIEEEEDDEEEEEDEPKKS